MFRTDISLVYFSNSIKINIILLKAHYTESYPCVWEFCETCVHFLHIKSVFSSNSVNYIDFLWLKTHLVNLHRIYLM